jgi:DNA-binding transcriptional LysR family regulator
MDRFTAMQVFTEVAERASLTDTAQALEMSRAMVSRYLESLEQWLGVRLLHRTTRRVSLTEAGEEALQRCRQVLELTRDVQSVAGLRRGAPSGKLRITTSASFAQAHLAAAMSEFLRRFPQAQVELIALERAVNLVEERIDLAVRIGNRLDDALLARQLGVCRSVICASPAYLAAHGQPATPADLRAHRCITHAYVGRSAWRLQRQGQTLQVPVNGALRSNEVGVMRQAALDGAGIALLPTYFVSEDLVQGGLVSVLPEFEPEPLGIHVVYLSRQHQTQLLRLMIDFLVERFGGAQAPWDLAIDAARSVPTRRATRRAPSKTPPQPSRPVKGRK